MKPTVPISNVALSDAAIRRNLLREGCTGRDYTTTGTSPIEQKGGQERAEIVFFADPGSIRRTNAGYAEHLK
ncbi:MAG: hypothetical protein DMG18_04325 [Acidobacteria bacterium]|nr:MAG: hypothetical protein DMG18_04325 [Acidobacteriota bacterium]